QRNSNCYANQAARAENTITAVFLYCRKVNREELNPVRDKTLFLIVPLCAPQCERMFNITRMPGEETDPVPDSKNLR
uniref:Choline/carnitine acyltransferase domain-containing protein n=1 Tax=Cyprinus carpio TaxID=7962 RepID=A0A8C2F2J7_CYPCA